MIKVHSSKHILQAFNSWGVHGIKRQPRMRLKFSTSKYYKLDEINGYGKIQFRQNVLLNHANQPRVTMRIKDKAKNAKNLMQLQSPGTEVCSLDLSLCITTDDRMIGISESLFSAASDAGAMVTASPSAVSSLLPGTSCDGDDDLVLGGGNGVTDGLSVPESLLISRTSIGSVELTRLI